jgi:hypothetical protein
MVVSILGGVKAAVTTQINCVGFNLPTWHEFFLF